MKALYTANALSTGGGRDGHVRSDDGQVDADVRPPKELGGAGGATNPEQLFAAGYAACFNSALQAVGRLDKVDASGSEVNAAVTLGALDNGGYGLAVALTVRVPNVDEATAQALADKAHQVCPYSNATRGNIEVTISVAA